MLPLTGWRWGDGELPWGIILDDRGGGYLVSLVLVD